MSINEGDPIPQEAIEKAGLFVTALWVAASHGQIPKFTLVDGELPKRFEPLEISLVDKKSFFVGLENFQDGERKGSALWVDLGLSGEDNDESFKADITSLRDALLISDPDTQTLEPITNLNPSDFDFEKMRETGNWKGIIVAGIIGKIMQVNDR